MAVKSARPIRTSIVNGYEQSKTLISGSYNFLHYLNDIANSYNSLLFTTIYDWFITWPPFCTIIIYKGGQVTNPIVFVKMSRKLLYI